MYYFDKNTSWAAYFKFGGDPLVVQVIGVVICSIGCVLTIWLFWTSFKKRRLITKIVGQPYQETFCVLQLFSINQVQLQCFVMALKYIQNIYFFQLGPSQDFLDMFYMPE